MNKIEKLGIAFANAFPVWVLAGAGLALWEPATANWFKPTWIPLFLSIIMLSMGLTLEAGDFLRILKIPVSVLVGLSLHYLIMPLLGYALSKAFHLPVDYMIGMVLVSSVPAGTASNVVCYIARINLALSVTLTTCSTLLGVIMTPLLATWMIESLAQNMIGISVKVDTLGIFIETFQIVILPVAAGILLNHYVPGLVRKVAAYTPFLAVLSIVFIVDSILAAKRQAILNGGSQLILAIAALHALGFFLGYLFSKLFALGERDARTISVEVGMQNSGLATELARHNFPAFGLATVPGAISALTHCIVGCVVAGLCRLFPHTSEPIELQEQVES
ncbi:MAG: sodium:bile acid symporter [Nitrospinae bacterium RIFCSPLOWO2_12_FULL_47_7]|nr:MAG: sodium:bile acid symporter [Nitrospinae bacterium RIFCSPLOWO2_12_FULL_47_7]